MNVPQKEFRIFVFLLFFFRVLLFTRRHVSWGSETPKLFFTNPMPSNMGEREVYAWSGASRGANNTAILRGLGATPQTHIHDDGGPNDMCARRSWPRGDSKSIDRKPAVEYVQCGAVPDAWTKGSRTRFVPFIYTRARTSIGASVVLATDGD